MSFKFVDELSGIEQAFILFLRQSFSLSINKLIYRTKRRRGILTWNLRISRGFPAFFKQF